MVICIVHEILSFFFLEMFINEMLKERELVEAT